MIILDTDVLSALMRKAPVAPVVAWLDRQPAESVWITVVTLFEVRFGLRRLAVGARRRALEAGFDRLLEEDLENRVLDFDRDAALAAADLAAERGEAGEMAHTAAFFKAPLAGGTHDFHAQFERLLAYARRHLGEEEAAR